jgi:hypothetical protein
MWRGYCDCESLGVGAFRVGIQSTLGYNVMKGIIVVINGCCSNRSVYNVMVNSAELIGTTEDLAL